MGLLRKLPSFSRPKTRPKEPEDRPPMPMPASSASPALQIDLGFDKVETTTTHTAVAGTHAAVEPPKPAPSASGPSTSLFDDIFSELKQQEHHDDSLLADYSLALAYTDQLQVSGTAPSVSNGTSVANGTSMASQGVAAPTRTLTTSTSLFGPDSIYSNYASTGAQQGESMFASLLKPLPGGGGGSLSVSTGMTTQSMPKSMSSPSMTTAATAAGPTRDMRTQLVLDSDVSDENDDEDDDDDDDDDATAGALIDARGSASLGPCPIMARRPHDHRLNVSRKVDNWAKQIETDPAAANQMMFNRMKDRHRQQYKLAAMRQQPPMPNNMPTMPNYANGANFVPAPPSMMQAHPDGLLPTSFSANAIAHMVVPSSMCAVAQPPPHLNGVVVPPVLHPAPPTRVPQPPVIDLRATSSPSPSASLPRSQSSTPCCTSPSNSSVSHVPSAKTVVDSEESDENDEIRENGEKSKNSDTDDKTTNQDNGHQDKADEKEALMPSQPMVRRPRSSSTASQKKKKDASLRRIKHAPLVAKQDEKDGTLARDASEQSDSDDADDEADDDASPRSSTSSSEALVPTPPHAPTLRPSASTGTAKRWSSTASRNKGPKKMQSVPDLKKKKRKSTPSSTSVSTAASGSTPMTPSTSSHTAAAAASGKQHDEPPMPPMPLIKSMHSEPDLKTLQQQHQNYYAFQQQQLLWKQQQLQTQQRQLQLEWERMQLHQRDQQLKQQFLQLQQHQQQLNASIVSPPSDPSFSTLPGYYAMPQMK